MTDVLNIVRTNETETAESTSIDVRSLRYRTVHGVVYCLKYPWQREERDARLKQMRLVDANLLDARLRLTGFSV